MGSEEATNDRERRVPKALLVYVGSLYTILAVGLIAVLVALLVAAIVFLV